MATLNKEIGTVLLEEIERGCDIVRISRLAYRMYSTNLGNLTDEQEDLLMELFSMEDDPQFEYSEKELRILAEKLMDNEEHPLKQLNEMRSQGILVDATSSNLQWLFQWVLDQPETKSSRLQIKTENRTTLNLRIELEGTLLSNKSFQQLFIDRSPQDWIFCEKTEGAFLGSCGPFKLPEVIKIFRRWSEG